MLQHLETSNLYGGYNLIYETDLFAFLREFSIMTALEFVSVWLSAVSFYHLLISVLASTNFS